MKKKKVPIQMNYFINLKDNVLFLLRHILEPELILVKELSQYFNFDTVF